MTNDIFFSVDRLVEFGMGMTIAQQMVENMNQIMDQMNVTGSISTIPRPSLKIYVAIDGKPIGPLDEKEFTQLVLDKSITKDTLTWTPGMLYWQPIEQTPAILKLVALTPPPINLTKT